MRKESWPQDLSNGELTEACGGAVDACRILETQVLYEEVSRRESSGALTEDDWTDRLREKKTRNGNPATVTAAQMMLAARLLNKVIGRLRIEFDFSSAQIAAVLQAMALQEEEYCKWYIQQPPEVHRRARDGFEEDDPRRWRDHA